MIFTTTVSSENYQWTKQIDQKWSPRFQSHAEVYCTWFDDKTWLTRRTWENSMFSIDSVEIFKPMSYFINTLYLYSTCVYNIVHNRFWRATLLLRAHAVTMCVIHLDNISQTNTPTLKRFVYTVYQPWIFIFLIYASPQS